MPVDIHMIRGHGIDIVDISRIRKLLEKYGNHFLEKYFGENEIQSASLLNDPAGYVASRFAAKEAFAKAVGTGFVGFGFSDVTIEREDGKPPYFVLSQKLHSAIPDAREEDFLLSLSHEKNMAVASVIWLGKS